MHDGAPDLCIIVLRDVADATMRIREAVEDLPLIVDIDTGFGNAVNAWHTVRALERAGADAVQIEDQVFPKRCGHFAGKARSEEHTSELQSLMRISYAVFCLNKKTKKTKDKQLQ